ncbi:hypothetical protein PVAND_007087 [Polypedilum vanderplanki]|uniref:Uncharacterized protein n=1 Tax=Polypedilum vanderplanki TaxID=319348 RepID=A0A9J6C6S7_POLVA|nr:hypothetical protein PVAND_007087 [Polypedilum vanderplanki]
MLVKVLFTVYLLLCLITFSQSKDDQEKPKVACGRRGFEFFVDFLNFFNPTTVATQTQTTIPASLPATVSNSTPTSFSDALVLLRSAASDILFNIPQANPLYKPIANFIAALQSTT